MKSLTIGLLFSSIVLMGCSKQIEYKAICTNPNLIRPIINCDTFRKCKESIISLGNHIIKQEGVLNRCTEKMIIDS